MERKVDRAQRVPGGQIDRREFLRRTGGLAGGVVAAGLLGAPRGASAGTPAGPVVKLGAVFPLTGPWAENGTNSLHGIQLAVEHVNAQGGIKAMGGAQLQVIPGDCQAD